MPLRHMPFGIPEKLLKQELVRRRHAHGRSLSPRRRELQRLRNAAADLSQYQSMLAAEAVVLEDEQRMLLRELAEIAGKPWQPLSPEPAEEPDPLAPQRRTLRHYRSLQTQLSGSVLSLIAPFLAPDPATRPGDERKEETAWPSGLAARDSGSGGR
ncbi:MAG TPA: hypothetical protein VD969_03035 [Symbiobacteriaceae bacterium]|nr:hypothetical protein [Symbiobacteriaceae bacterium]